MAAPKKLKVEQEMKAVLKAVLKVIVWLVGILLNFILKEVPAWGERRRSIAIERQLRS